MPFAEAAPYYRYRAPYPAEAFEFLRSTFQLDKNSRVIDLGCGPGTVTIPLAAMVGYVLAVDPSQAMIDQGRADAAEAGCDNIEWLCSRAEDISAQQGQFTVATLGQAFHWMDRDLVLCRMETMLIPRQGGLALIAPGRRRPQESWEPLLNEVLARYIQLRPRHELMNKEPENEPALKRSSTFGTFETREFATEITRDIPSIIGYAYSLSTSPRSAFGERARAFELELTAALLRSNPSGRFKERVETEVLIAHAGR